MAKWGGRRASRLVALTLSVKGDVCWLCGGPGANSADHEPPRSALLASGVADPDALDFLRPAHLLCNQFRGTRPVTDELRAELAAHLAGRASRVRALASSRFNQVF